MSTVTEEELFRGVPLEEVLADLRLACVSRALDERQITLNRQGRSWFQIAGAGHESLLLGLARHLRAGYDWFFPYYRDQPLALGLGVSPTQILLQAVGSAEDIASGGRQMPSHWSDTTKNLVTQTSATGSQCIPAVGCAEAGRYIARHPGLPGCTGYDDELTYISIGEGTTSEGEFWESLSSASMLKLPVLYVVADNGYAISVPSWQQGPGPISEMVSGFANLHVRALDGTDYFAVREVAREVLPLVRSGQGPALLHAKVTRPFSHSGQDTQARYRSAEDLADEASRDPIDRLERTLIEAGVLSEAEAAAIRAEAHQVAADAAAEALRARRPRAEDLPNDVVALPDVPLVDPPADGAGPEVTFGEAITRTLHEQMAADERIRVFGEDVADASEDLLEQVEGKGGVFGTTAGLQRAFGSDRCYNTPLSEAVVVGRAVGQGLRGLRPAPEIQFFDYIWPAMSQLKTEAATIRWRSNGTWKCPMVLRVPIGGYLNGGGIWHSQSGEAIFAHIPGLLIAFPSRARDAVGLLRTAFTCEDPVLYLEHKHLLRQPYTVDRFPAEGWKLPFGVGEVRRPGRHATVVSWGATVEKSLQAAAALAPEGWEVEVIDLRTIAPWDRDIVAGSVARTRRLLVVHEDVLTGGFGAEVAAWVGEHCFADLDAPVRRLAALDMHVAYEPTMEQVILPQVDDITIALEELLAY